jgi:hypothetical protein
MFRFAGFSVLALPLVSGTAQSASSVWFDPTQLPSFRGSVERYLPNPNGHPDRLIFKEGSQVVFPPEVLEAIEQAAQPGKELVVWGVRARSGPIITMLAFAVPDGEPTLLDRFYWRPVHGNACSEERLRIAGKVRAAYLTPEGTPAGAILEDGSVIRIESAIAERLKDRLAEHAKIAAEGVGCATQNGKAIDALRVGETPESLQELPPVVQPLLKNSDVRR